MLSKNYTPRSVLITGGAGFIGSNFIRYLLANNSEVNIINLDLLTYAGSLKNLNDLPDASRHFFIQGDVCDKELVLSILRDYCIDTIIHFAAESHVDNSIKGPAPFIQTNIVGTFSLLEAALQYWFSEKKWQSSECRFHHISTDEVFGTLSKDEAAFTEKTAYAPNSPYSASKASSDHLVRAYFHTYHLPITISNCSNNYGPYQHKEKLIPTVIQCCLDWKTIPVYGDGSNIRDWLYVEDHCEAIFKIVTHGKVGETYNIGGQHETNNLTVVNEICHLFDERYPKDVSYKSLISFVADRPGHDWRYGINISKISKELNWHPQANFKAGLLKTVDFYVRG